MTMFWYIFWIIVLICVLLGLVHQLEIEKYNEERERRRKPLRIWAWEAYEQVIYRSHDPNWKL